MNLNQITLDVSDIPQSRAFYLKLGFRLLVDADHYCRFLAPAGDTTFSIQKVDKVMPSGSVLYLETDQLSAEYDRLVEAGIVFESAPEAQSWLWHEAVFRDPDGHKWKLYHAGKNRIDPPWRVKG